MRDDTEQHQEDGHRHHDNVVADAVRDKEKVSFAGVSTVYAAFHI